MDGGDASDAYVRIDLLFRSENLSLILKVLSKKMRVFFFLPFFLKKRNLIFFLCTLFQSSFLNWLECFLKHYLFPFSQKACVFVVREKVFLVSN